MHTREASFWAAHGQVEQDALDDVYEEHQARRCGGLTIALSGKVIQDFVQSTASIFFRAIRDDIIKTIVKGDLFPGLRLYFNK
ncbi:hypothetical protein KESI111651_04195 [Kerstersia similis]